MIITTATPKKLQLHSQLLIACRRHMGADTFTSPIFVSINLIQFVLVYMLFVDLSRLPEDGVVQVATAVELDGRLQLHDGRHVALRLRVRELLHRRVKVVDVRLLKRLRVSGDIQTSKHSNCHLTRKKYN